MSDDVSWNLQLAVRDGGLDEARALMVEMIAATRDEAGALAYEWHFSADGTTCHINERYADSAAAMAHLGTFGSEFAERFLGVFSPTAFSVYGDPTDDLRAALAGFGAVHLERLGGFRR
jgi:quinol monooxygenase YgiN